jgi:hypothetical protein
MYKSELNEVYYILVINFDIDLKLQVVYSSIVFYTELCI